MPIRLLVMGFVEIKGTFFLLCSSDDRNLLNVMSLHFEY
jgi:hypothetical protein